MTDREDTSGTPEGTEADEHEHNRLRDPGSDFVFYDLKKRNPDVSDEQIESFVNTHVHWQAMLQLPTPALRTRFLVDMSLTAAGARMPPERLAGTSPPLRAYDREIDAWIDAATTQVDGRIHPDGKLDRSGLNQLFEETEKFVDATALTVLAKIRGKANTSSSPAFQTAATEATRVVLMMMLVEKPPYPDLTPPQPE